MKRYLIQRILQVIPLLICISMMSFFIMQLAPGSFLDQFIMDPEIPKEYIVELEEEFGLNQPVYQQYFYWLWRVLHLDFGRSFKWNVPVTYIIGTRIVNTLILSGTAMLITWIVAIPIGIYSATHRYKLGDHLFSVLSFIGISIPNFFFALLLLFLIVKYHLGLPTSGMTSVNFDFLSPWGKMIDILQHLLVPALVLGTAGMAGLMRQMRGQMIEVMGQDYIQTARSKGLTNKVVIYKHALRNALNPIITIFGFQFSSLLSGAALTETVTGWPGLGKMMLEAVRFKDVYLVMAGFMMSSILLLVGNMFADFLLAVIDPKIRYV